MLGLPWQMVPTLYRSLIAWETKKQTSQNYLHVKVSKISRFTVFIQYEGAFYVKIKIFTGSLPGSRGAFSMSSGILCSPTNYPTINVTYKIGYKLFLVYKGKNADHYDKVIEFLTVMEANPDTDFTA